MSPADTPPVVSRSAEPLQDQDEKGSLGSDPNPGAVVGAVGELDGQWVIGPIA
jgi:hypothetical protein